MNNNPPAKCSVYGILECPMQSVSGETEGRQALEILKSFGLHLIVSLAFLAALDIFDRALVFTTITAEFKGHIKFIHEWLALTTYVVFVVAVAYKFITRMWRWVKK